MAKFTSTSKTAPPQAVAAKLIPSPRAIALFTMVGGMSLALSLLAKGFPALAQLQVPGLPLFACFIGSVLFGGDYLSTRRQSKVSLERQLPGSLALNQWAQVHITVNHGFSHEKRLVFFDGISSKLVAEGAQNTVLLRPGQQTFISYRLRALQRGPLRFECCHIEVPGPMGLWLQRYTVPLVSMTKVYPDFAAITTYTLLACENHTSQLDIRTRSRRGQGAAFHQLREYRQGDSLRQLDWNATAKRLSLISKEYQDERDQNVILMIDSGRRMSSQDDELSHFDHALNASMLISYIALRQGDSVGVMSFGGHDRWIPPQKGGNRVNVILNGLYDLHAGNNPPDYLAAAEKLVTLQRKRSLIILVTNSRDEEIDELMMAIRLLKKRHLVLVANIRETILDQTVRKPVMTVPEAASYAGTLEYLQHRAAVHKKLQGQGIFAVDTLARHLPAKLANSYWEIKRAGTL